MEKKQKLLKYIKADLDSMKYLLDNYEHHFTELALTKINNELTDAYSVVLETLKFKEL